MQKEPFLQAIFAKPDSLAINAYADYLKEQGEWNADLIRVSIVNDIRIPIGEGFGDPSWMTNAPGCGWGYGYDHDYYEAHNGDGQGCAIWTSQDDGYGLGNGNGSTEGDYNRQGTGLGQSYFPNSGSGEANRNGYGYGKGYQVYQEHEDPFQLKKEQHVQGKYILVCDRGWVHVGDCQPNPEDVQQLIVDRCATVRVWGTDAGLGQLAKEGPRKETILDTEGDGVILRRDWIKRAIPCNEEAWADYFK